MLEGIDMIARDAFYDTGSPAPGNSQHLWFLAGFRDRAVTGYATERLLLSAFS
jgi:hypothetical protein